MKKAKLYLLSLGLFAFLISGTLIIAELVLRWMSVSAAMESHDHVTATDYTPITFRRDYEGVFWEIPFRTNRYGFRDEENFPEKRPDSEVRVLSLGDSIGFGLGVEAEEHYTQVAEEILSPPGGGKTLRIVNAGGQGYSPSGYLVYLRNRGFQLEPSRIVAEIEVCNDLTDEALLSWDRIDADGLPWAIVGGRYQVSWDGRLLGTYSTGSYFFERSYLYTVLIRRVLNLLQRWDTPELYASNEGARVLYSLGFDRYLLDAERLEEGWRRMFEALEGMARLARDRGIPFSLMVMPSRFMYRERGAYTKYAEDLYQRALAEARNRAIPIWPMKEAISEGGGDRLFFDFAHLTKEGNRVVGEELAQRLGRLRKP